MESQKDWKRFGLKTLSYLLVAVLASTISLALWGERYDKLEELENLIEDCFIGEYDRDKMQDAAAAGMVYALSDRWSSYLSAEEYAVYKESSANAYMGVGITIKVREDKTGHDIIEVVAGGPAEEAGVLPGDILTGVAGQSIGQLTTNEVATLVQGKAGTKVDVTVNRDGEVLELQLERRQIRRKVAEGTLLPGKIGLIRIENFNTGCSEETIAAVEALRQQGAISLIFDVRNNPGGYVAEMVKVLDHLLPEGVVFREEDYRGNTGEKTSDANCVELPMAVLVNGDSYSAAEFFAACLREYEWATVVGEQTCGKGYYQNTIQLSDGSAVVLSTGKYSTPNGVNLTEVGGLTPDVPLAVDAETAAKIYAKTLAAEEDPQLQAAIAELQKTPG